MKNILYLIACLLSKLLVPLSKIAFHDGIHQFKIEIAEEDHIAVTELLSRIEKLEDLITLKK